MFVGEFTHTLDGKGRVVMPSAFRPFLEEGCVIAQGRDGNLSVFTIEAFQAQAQHLEGPLDRAGRLEARATFRSASSESLDGQGRLLIKPVLRRYAQIEGRDEVTVVGLSDHIEIWNPELFADDAALADEKYRQDKEAPGF